MNNQKNSSYWEKIANMYHAHVGEQGDIRHELIINPIVFGFLGNLEGMVVLDAACGNGYLSRKLSERANTVIGVDFTASLIELAKQQNNPENLQFRVGSVTELQFEDQFFDVVLCNMALMDIEKLDDAIGELSRVLKVGGKLVISILHPCFENPPRTYSLFDEQDNQKVRVGTVVQKYFTTGLVVDERNVVSNGEYYQHYHHMMSDYLNAFAKSDLCIEEVSEPNGSKIFRSLRMDDGNDETPTFMIFNLEKVV